MKFEYLFLVLGLICLAIPTPVISPGKVREKLRQPARRHEDGIVSLLRSRLNWVDLIRGAAGAWLVQREFQRYTSGQDDLAMAFTFAQMALLFVGVLAQTIWIDRPPKIIGPAFFLAGITLVASGPMVGGFALVLGLACALMLGRLRLGFVVIPACLLAFGMLFQQLRVMVLFNAALFLMPVFLAFAAGVRIVFVRRPADLRAPREDSRHPHSRGPAGTVISPDFTNPRAEAAAHLA
jgi:hypothetical protein